MIGYSGLDQGVLELLGWGERPIRSLCVVSESTQAAEATMARIQRRVPLLPGAVMSIVPAGFAEFARDGSIDRYIEEIRVAGS